MKYFTASRAACLWLAVVMCGVLATGTGVAAEKSKAPAPATKAATEKAPVKAKSKSKSKGKAKPAAAKKKDDAQPHPSTLPWTLRGQYGIGYNNLSFVYSTDNAEWCIVRDKTETLVDNVGMTITLGDGGVVNVVEFTRDATDFKDIKDDTGNYRQFWVQMAPQKGLNVRHWVDRYNDRPYMLLRSEIKNVGDKPVTIREVAPVVLGPKGIMLSADAGAVMRPVIRRGGYAVYDPRSTRFVVLTDTAKKFLFAIGQFPETSAPGAVSFQKAAEGWQGKITCDYSPGHVLKPGESLKVEPLLLDFFMPKPTDIDIGYAMAMSSLPKPARPAPPAWVTVPATESAQALLAAAQAWAGSDVKHVLVPAPYSGPSGYLYDAKQIAGDIKALKMTPGIAIDPLGAQGAAENLSVAGPNGRRWINPTLPEARDYAAAQLKPLTDCGYAFFVVPPSEVPDEALTAIGISRGEADVFAFDIAIAAAGDRPVVPSAAATLANELDPWLEADAATARLRMHEVAVGPVRVDAAKLGDPSDGLAMAIAFYPGPVELVGVPSKRVKSLFPRPVTFAQPIDCRQVPKLWQAQELKHRDAATSFVVAFPGAPAWTDADLAAGFEGKPKSLRVEQDGSVNAVK